MTYEVEGAGQTARMTTTGGVSNVYNWWSNGHWYELPLLQHWQTLAAPAVYIDVGAHAGNHTVWAAKAWPRARVWALEPARGPYRHLLKNTLANGALRVNCLRAVASDNHGGAAHTESFGDDEGQRRVADDGVRVQSVALDAVCRVDRGSTAVIKVDVEDINLPVLRGARGILARADCRLYIECATFDCLKETGDYLAGCGYKMTGRVWGSTPVYEAVRV